MRLPGCTTLDILLSSVEIGFNESRPTYFDPSTGSIPVYNVDREALRNVAACKLVIRSSHSTATR